MTDDARGIPTPADFKGLYAEMAENAAHGRRGIAHYRSRARVFRGAGMDVLAELNERRADELAEVVERVDCALEFGDDLVRLASDVHQARSGS